MSTLISGLDDAELKHMFKFAVERQRMYNRWSACKKVSKKDILRTGKLSNVHRYLDRETVYVLSSIIQPMLAEEYTKGDLLFNLPCSASSSTAGTSSKPSACSAAPPARVCQGWCMSNSLILGGTSVCPTHWRG